MPPVLVHGRRGEEAARRNALTPLLFLEPMEYGQCDRRNLTMVMDLYELTMSNGYFLEGSRGDVATFDVFFRRIPDDGGYAIFAGLEQILDYIENLHFEEDDIEYLRSLGQFDERFLSFLETYRFHGDVYAFEEGTVMFPGEPVISVTAPMIDAQMVETAILAQFNHQSLIATKTSRIVRAARGRPVSDFGARRAHNMDAAVYGARAAYIGGASGSATVLSGKMFGIPVSGTMAHSWVMYHDSEYEAFERYARTYPDGTLLLIDTYDVLGSGVPNAIRCAKEVLEPMGKRLLGVRIDSGDLAYLTKEIRRMLDEAGLTDAKIVASNSLDEYSISSILDQGGCIDSFGVGERLITSSSDPVFGGVYKISAVEKDGVVMPKIKVSETVEKITNPGRKSVYRIYDRTGHAVADLIAGADEAVDASEPFRVVDTVRPWKKIVLRNCTAKPLLQKVIEDGRRVGPRRSLEEVRDHVRRQLESEIWQEEQRFDNPHLHHLDMTPEYYKMKMELLEKSSSPQNRSLDADPVEIQLDGAPLSQRCPDVEYPLVLRTAEAQTYVPARLDVLSVDDHVHQGKHLVGHLAPRSAVSGELLPSVAAVGPHVLIWKLSADPSEKSYEGPLVGGLPGLSSQNAESADERRFEGLHYALLDLGCVLLPVFEIPCRRLEAAVATVCAAGNEQRCAHPSAVGDVGRLQLAVMHGRFPPVYGYTGGFINQRWRTRSLISWVLPWFQYCVPM